MAYSRRFLMASNLTSNPLPVAAPPQDVEVESDFIVILAALICAIICVLGLIAVARCTWIRRRISPTTTPDSTATHPSANKGLKKKVLNSLPKYTYNSENTNKSIICEDCAICLTEYCDGDEIRVLPQCGHRFHVQCIDTWLGSHSSCPSCRQVLVVNRCRKCGDFDSSAGEGGENGGGGSFKLTKINFSSAASSSSSPTFLP